MGELLAADDYLQDPDINFQSKYKPTYARIATTLCGNLGATDYELAEVFGVQVQTLMVWRMRHPEFNAACKLGEDVSVDRVERALYARATGFQHMETKVHFDKGGSVHTFDVTKVYPPDVEAAKFYLMNKRRKTWKMRQEVTVEDAEYISTDDLLRRLNTGKG